MAWLLDLFTKPSHHVQDDDYREAIRESAKVGGKLFGPVPEGVRREFFCLDSRTWVWHEEWTDSDGKIRFCTTRYDMRPNGIIKAQDGQPYTRIGEEEAERLLYAIRTYNETIDRELASYLHPAAA